MENDYDINKAVREGAVIKGRVSRKENGDIYVDINFKSEGIIPAEETSKYAFFDLVKEGDELDVYIKRVEGRDGMVLLSKIVADKRNIFGGIKKAFESKDTVEGTVSKAVKGGYIVDFGANITAFLPMSHSRLYGQSEDMQGKKLMLKVIQLDEAKRNIVVSYKEYLAEQQKAEEESIKKNFPVNEKATVIITAVTDKGVEVEKDGLKLYIPAAELTWSKTADISAKYRQGDQLEVLVVQGDKNRVALSARRLQENPFKKFVSEIKIGDRVKAVVKDTVAQGVRLMINDGIEGFLPASEISYYKRIKDPSETLKPGQEINPMVFKIDAENERVLLSMKRTERNPWDDIDDRYPAGSRVTGAIKDIKEGAGVEVEMEENIEAFVPLSEVSWFSFNQISDVLKQGEKREFKVMGADRQKFRINLSLKQLMASPWDTFMAKYKEGSHMDVKILDIEDASVLCQIVEGVNGRILIRNRARVTSKKGDVISARISKIDREHKKVLLASDGFEVSEEKKEIEDYIKTHEHKFTLSDAIQIKKTDKTEGQ